MEQAFFILYRQPLIGQSRLFPLVRASRHYFGHIGTPIPPQHMYECIRLRCDALYHCIIFFGKSTVCHRLAECGSRLSRLSKHNQSLYRLIQPVYQIDSTAPALCRAPVRKQAEQILLPDILRLHSQKRWLVDDKNLVILIHHHPLQLSRCHPHMHPLLPLFCYKSARSETR